MDLLLEFLSLVLAGIGAFLIAANILSVVGYFFHQRQLVERLQRRLVHFTALMRIGIR